MSLTLYNLNLEVISKRRGSLYNRNATTPDMDTSFAFSRRCSVTQLCVSSTDFCCLWTISLKGSRTKMRRLHHMITWLHVYMTYTMVWLNVIKNSSCTHEPKLFVLTWYFLYSIIKTVDISRKFKSISIANMKKENGRKI